MDQYVAKTSGHVGSGGIHVDSWDEVSKSIKTWVDAGLIVTVNILHENKYPAQEGKSRFSNWCTGCSGCSECKP